MTIEERPMGVSRDVTTARGWVVDGAGVVVHRLIPGDRRGE
jgi:hypothetical protein